MTFTPFSYQLIAADFLIAHPHAFLLDFTGLGKTPESIFAHQQVGGKFIVASESNKLFDWKLEYSRWAPSISRFLVQGDKVARHKIYNSFITSLAPAVLIINHHKIFPDLDVFLNLKVDGVIIDEAENFNNDETKLWQYMKWILKGKQFVWQLSAYPFGINLLQFYNLFAMMELGHLFGSRWDFIDKYCVVDIKHFYIHGHRIKKKVIVGAKNVDEFKAIASSYCLRRTKQDVGLELPPVRFSAIGCQLTNRQKVLYQAAKRNRLATMTRQEQFEPIAKYAFITQILDSPHLIDDREEAISPKLDEAILLFKKINDKVVVYSQFLKWQPELIKRFQEAGIPVIAFHGGLSSKVQDELIQSFRDAQNPVVFLVTAAAERGINLQFAHELFVLDFPFNPVSVLQLFGRLDRIGQQNDVSIHYFVMEDSHEEIIFERLFERQQLVDQVLSGNRQAAFDLEKLFKEILSYV